MRASYPIFSFRCHLWEGLYPIESSHRSSEYAPICILFLHETQRSVCPADRPRDACEQERDDARASPVSVKSKSRGHSHEPVGAISVRGHHCILPQPRLIISMIHSYLSH